MSNQLPPTTPIQPNNQPQSTPPQPVYGYQQPPPSYGQQPQQPYYQQPPQAYANPNYRVATPNVDGSNHVMRWVGYNILAMILSSVIFGVLFFVIVIWLFIDGSQAGGILDSINTQAGEVGFTIGLFAGMAGISALMAGLLQRVGLHNQVSYWPWMLKTGFITALTTSISLAIFFFMINPNTTADTYQLINTLYLTASTAFIALATALGQLSEVRKIAQQPFAWVITTVLTWTCLSAVLWGGLIFSL